MAKLNDLQKRIILLLKNQLEESKNFNIPEGLRFLQIMEKTNSNNMCIYRALENLTNLGLIAKAGEKPFTSYIFRPTREIETYFFQARCPKCNTDRGFCVDGEPRFSSIKELNCLNPNCLTKNKKRTRFIKRLRHCILLNKTIITPKKIITERYKTIQIEQPTTAYRSESYKIKNINLKKEKGLLIEGENV